MITKRRLSCGGLFDCLYEYKADDIEFGRPILGLSRLKIYNVDS